MAPAHPKISRVESLPTELLEQIFLESLNLNLPLASSHLGAVLSSHRTKMAVVLKVFPSNAFSNIEHYIELSQTLWAGGAKETETAIGELQSRLLACRWMTWDFLKLCMETFVVRTLLREFRIQDLPWQEGLPVEEQPDDVVRLPWHGGAPVKGSVVRDFVHELFALNVHLWFRYDGELDHCEDIEDNSKIIRDNMRTFKQHRANLEANGQDESEESDSDMDDDDEDLDRGYQYLGVATREWNKNDTEKDNQDVILTSSLRTYSWGPVDGTPRISIGIGPRDGLVILGTRLKCETDPKMVETTSRRWRCLWCRFDTNIPVKLLRGPWTQDRLSFLQALLEGGADLDPENETHREIAKQGLTDAIKEDDYRAVDLLISGAMNRQYRYADDNNYFEPSFGEAAFIMNVPDKHRDWVKTPMERRTLGIKPDTEHLKVAVIERGCRRRIVKRLLWAASSDIDRADPAVVDWAEKKNEQGDRIGQCLIGDWLLGQLASSGDMDREQRDFMGRSQPRNFSTFACGCSDETRSDSQSGDDDEIDWDDTSESDVGSPSVSDDQGRDGDQNDSQDTSESDVGSPSVSDA